MKYGRVWGGLMLGFLVILWSGIQRGEVSGSLDVSHKTVSGFSSFWAVVPIESESLAVISQSEITTTVEISPTVQDGVDTFICPFLRGRSVEGAFDSAAMAERVRYVVHLPPCYEFYPESAFPVLYLFHGWPFDEWHWPNLGIAALADDWISRGIVGPFIIVMPGVGSEGRYVHSSGGPYSFEGMVIDELVPLIERDYRAWQEPAGRAVGGISRGGVWAVSTALLHQEVFGILGAHSPALALNRPLPQYDPFLLVQREPPNLRIYLDAGDADWARSQTSRFRDVLLAQGVEVVYQVHTGGHVDALWRGGVPDYLDFYTATWPPTYDDLPSCTVCLGEM